MCMIKGNKYDSWTKFIWRRVYALPINIHNKVHVMLDRGITLGEG